MDEIIRELAASVADTTRDEITAIFNDYKDYMDASDIAFWIDRVFHKMIWNIEINVTADDEDQSHIGSSLPGKKIKNRLTNKTIYSIIKPSKKGELIK